MDEHVLLQRDIELISAQHEIPSGFTLKACWRAGNFMFRRLMWSPDGTRVAAICDDSNIRIWSYDSQQMQSLPANQLSVQAIEWSPNGRMIASAVSNKNVLIWDVDQISVLKQLETQAINVKSIAWAPNGRLLAVSSGDRTVDIWNVDRWEVCKTLTLPSPTTALSWSNRQRHLAAGCSNSMIRVWHTDGWHVLRNYQGHLAGITDVAWGPTIDKLITASSDSTIRIWALEGDREAEILEGFAKEGTLISLSADQRMLGTRSFEGGITLLRTDKWEPIASFFERRQFHLPWLPSLAFHPRLPILATVGERDRVVRIWELSPDIVAQGVAPYSVVRLTSAKIVLVGESNAGKSCLAMRLAEDRYPADRELGTTHGLRFWRVTPEHFEPNASAPEGQRREVVLWDMGGQDEYRLIHQLFLHDTTVALIVFDPTRGRIAYEEVEAWNMRLVKQLRGRRCAKILVGAKVDQPTGVVDAIAIERLRNHCGCIGYYETSALTNRGIDSLRTAIARTIDWNSLATTSRPELYQKIRDEISDRQDRGEVFLTLDELDRTMRAAYPEKFPQSAISEVTEQLAAQGIIAESKQSTGERTLILRLEEIERYGGSLILSARHHERGVPVLEAQQVASPDMLFPGIPNEGRLPRLQERIVLECVVELLIEHGICFSHQGLLVFGSLFREVEEKPRFGVSQPASVYYDFSGAIDNIYASLVSWLAISGQFGQVRLWHDRAEFYQLPLGVCGIRKVDRGSGFAHIDISFDQNTIESIRDGFVGFVEDHLRQWDVDIGEHIKILCPSCGYEFPEDIVHERIARSESDIGCLKCDARLQIALGAAKARERDPQLEGNIRAWRGKAQANVMESLAHTKRIFAPRVCNLNRPTIRILHLSDLHFDADVDVDTMLQPLIADLRDNRNGFCYRHLDYLLVSGDMTNHATPEEFENARKFLSKLINTFELTALRCVLVPGNHDQSWDVEAYRWVSKHLVNIKELKKGFYREEGEGYLVRNDDNYLDRFRNFSEFLYHPLLQVPYPRRFEEQGVPYFFAEDGIQFLALNSSWETDLLHRNRSSTHMGALARGLAKANDQTCTAVNRNRPILKIGVWHHPVTGNEKIVDDAFMEQLTASGFRLVLHGHVHEERDDQLRYHYKKTYVAGAGSFGAPANDRPESTPRLYNLLEYDQDKKTVRVHTRSRRKETGAWDGWYRWHTSDPTYACSYYDLKLD